METETLDDAAQKELFRINDDPAREQTTLREALRIIAELRAAGFVAYLAGGCVRDALIQRQPKDFDVATNATPESVRDVFGRKQTLAFGASFGVIGVLPPRKTAKHDSTTRDIVPTEVATFRSDGDYSDGRRPDSVQFGDAEQDALRRDFTINGMFYDPQIGTVIDFVGGLDDLRNRVLRTIGNATDRFGEDKLRMLRAVRFATTLGFDIQPDTANAIRRHARDVAVVSGERIGAEMRKVMMSPNALDGLRKLIDCELVSFVLPELVGLDIKQLKDPFAALTHRDFESTMALLMIHLNTGKAGLKAIANRWKLSNEETRRILAAVDHWSCVANCEQTYAWSQVQPVLIDRDASTIVNVAKAMVAADNLDSSGISTASEALSWPESKLDPAPLLTGDDLKELGFQPGPGFAQALKATREQQLDGEITTREDAIDLSRKFLR